MGLLDFIGGLFQTSANKRSQNRQNDFNAAQAALNRQFQSQEAEIARDWQEQQYNQYSSPSAMVRQYQEAGLNPALMYGQNLQGSTGSSPTPSGSAASGSAPNSGMPTGNILEAIAGFAKLKAEIDNINADTDFKRSQAGLAGSQIEVNKQSINESQARISKLLEETKNEAEKRGLIVAQKLLANVETQLKTSQIESISYDVLKKKFDEQFKQDYGTYPANSLYDSVWKIVQGIGESSIFKKLFNFN